MTAALLFVATFALVFLLGVQQLTVERGHKLAAFVTSPLISGMYLVLFKLLPGPTDAFQIAMHMLGGALGIVAGMWLHPRLVSRLARYATSADDTIGAELLGFVGTLEQAEDQLARIHIDQIKHLCEKETLRRFTWYDTSTREKRLYSDLEIDRTVSYLEVRKQLVRHPVQRHLVRFPR